MEKTRKSPFPRWLFATLAVGGLLACGIYIGIISVEGFTMLRFVQATGYGILGLIMFWGAIQRQ